MTTETMSASSIKDDLERGGFTGLVHNVELGLHTMPDGFTDNYRKIGELVDEHSDRFGNLRDWKAEKEIAETMRKLGEPFAGHGIATLIEHIQPAMAKMIDGMRDDFGQAGRYVSYTGSPGDLLTEAEPVRQAYTRLLHSHGRYHGLRSSWLALRIHDGYELFDQLGLNSPLAEVANLPDVVADWKLANAGRAPWPWNGTAHHIRMFWLLSNGAQIWCPTGAEQNGMWHKYNPGVRLH